MFNLKALSLDTRSYRDLVEHARNQESYGTDANRDPHLRQCWPVGADLVEPDYHDSADDG